MAPILESVLNLLLNFRLKGRRPRNVSLWQIKVSQKGRKRWQSRPHHPYITPFHVCPFFSLALAFLQILWKYFSWTHAIRKHHKMAGQNTFQILLLNDANMNTRKQEWKCVLLRKSTFCPKLTLILDFEETETHYGQSLVMAYSLHFQIPCTGSKVPIWQFLKYLNW